jgi:hypothetical protein
MFSDVIALIFGILGIVFVLLSLVFKVITWREETYMVALPLYTESDEIYTRICNLTDFTEFCGIHKKCTVVIINYGASDKFCNNLENYFRNCISLKIINSNEQSDLIFKELHT